MSNLLQLETGSAMQISSLTFPKDRTGRQAGDDSLLILPGICGVFDGASSGATGPGMSPGQAASRAAASVLGEFAATRTMTDIPAGEIFSAVRERISQTERLLGNTFRASTTMAAAFFGVDKIRLLVVGDSGIRINGDQVYRRLKHIDDLSTTARIEVFNMLNHKERSTDEVEAQTRRISFQGLDYGVREGLLTEDDAIQICSLVTNRYTEIVAPQQAEAFLRTGIRCQYMYANRSDHPLGYSSLNCDPILMDDVIDVSKPAEDIETLEFFTDGYFDIPGEVSVSAWEKAFDACETVDFHKTKSFPSIKGSTSREFADDRSVIVVRNS
ncbi:MAG: hypothetical protein K5905_23245 [Roseibium sp.]|uniref:hypothetical protein n=1 Tax=Roseibium sp. TaxID=1936156 RepID=UPI00261E5F80|nr:hypothetical protein [Roseibium sp.]MCV0428384.1 hypothetical protein [Roseibium sp.]